MPSRNDFIESKIFLSCKEDLQKENKGLAVL